jgi:hypothetical protein
VAQYKLKESLIDQEKSKIISFAILEGTFPQDMHPLLIVVDQYLK